MNITKREGLSKLAKVTITEKELKYVDLYSIYKKIGKALLKDEDTFMDVVDQYIGIKDFSKYSILDSSIYSPELLQDIESAIFDLEEKGWINHLMSCDKHEIQDIIYDGSIRVNLIPKTTKKCRFGRRYFRNNYNSIGPHRLVFNTLDVAAIVGHRYVESAMHNYFEENTSMPLLLSPEIETYSRVFKNTFNLLYYTLGKRDITMADIDNDLGKQYNIKKVATLNFIMYLLEISVSVYLQNKYDKESKGMIAKAFETKKHINKEILDVMHNSKLNAYFSYLELDNSVDLGRFRILEQSILENISNSGYNENNKKPELRFRKLGKHHASGMYFPHVNCICVDPRTTTSFLHEFGHYIDYNFSDNGQISMSQEFLSICLEYRNILRAKKIVKRNFDYLSTPTEIFARCYEMYLVRNNIVDGDILNKSSYREEDGYINLSDEATKYLDNLFDKVLGKNTKLTLTA